MFAGLRAPSNWAFCDGRLLNLNTYQALYSLIGTTYGGDGVTTFALPDLRSRLPVGQGSAAGMANYVLGTQAGAEAIALTAAQMPAHTHPFMASTAATDATAPFGRYLGDTSDVVVTVTSGTSVTPTQLKPFIPPGASAMTTVTLAPAAVGSEFGSGAHENRMPCVAINFIIALNGVYPSRP
jgi:microcystin-dependent protein